MLNIPNYAHSDYTAWGFRAGLKTVYQLVPNTHIAAESAIDATIIISLLLHCRVASYIHEGIIGTGGWVPAGERRTSIKQVALQDESCSLIAITTADESIHPLELRTVALNIARVVRAGGSARQGNHKRVLSVFLAGGTTTEIMGIPGISQLPLLAHYEAMRQKSLLDLRQELIRRGLSSEHFLAINRDIDVTETTGEILRDRFDRKPNDRLSVLVLSGMRGLSEWETGPGCTFTGELAERVHPVCVLWDEKRQDEWRKVAHAEVGDAVLVLIGAWEQLSAAKQGIIQRCAEACLGVPRELRHWLPDGSTRFIRLLPDAGYRESTNCMLGAKILPERVAALRAQLPPSPYARERRWLNVGLHSELVRDMLDTPALLQDALDSYLDRGGRNPAPVAHFLSAGLKAAEKAGEMQTEIEPAAITRLLDACRQGEIAYSGLIIGLGQYLSGGMEALEVYLDETREGIVNDPEGWGRREVSRLREADPNASSAKIMSRAMERLMLEANGKVEGAHLAEAVRVALER